MRALLAASVHTAIADWLAAPVDRVDHSFASRKLDAAAAAAASTMIDTARALDSCFAAVAAEVHNSVAIGNVVAETEEACTSYRSSASPVAEVCLKERGQSHCCKAADSIHLALEVWVANVD